MAEPLISVKDLRVAFGGASGPIEVVRGISFDLGREKLGIVGESGSGKSLTGRSIMRLLPAGARLSASRIAFAGEDLQKASERRMEEIRGRGIGFIMQDPKYSLNPVVTVGEQIAEAYRLHVKASAATARERAIAMLRTVQIRDPERVFGMYPHEMSGGMGQRIMIAMMLVAEPQALIADEPTSALDVTVRLEILALLDDLVATRGLGLIFISHDLNLVRRFCDRVLIMYRGRVVEELAAGDLGQATHPYTRGLLEALPRIHARRPRLPTMQRDPNW
ncbi:ABC transporter ATP-binding protein [uncultured Alsobacter sp.]|uniref:ABC transporter ATP-binding protein n=1 Tax=uncultured Alsobacter sp. TaxID=1748258 RepID=UPI0025D7DC44|nr:ABC transporter ATP-binding protein [uncultured Alsobacter sp.]